jgi:two-component system chemotaxis response regulator CheY
MPHDAPIVAIIDDDKIFQLTASKTILASQVTNRILQFENGEDALQFLKSNLSNSSVLPDYIFLDINMPFVDGWMFLEDYAKLTSSLSKPATIYMVSSSIDPRDIARAKSNSHIADYVVKPVTSDKFAALLKRVA